MPLSIGFNGSYISTYISFMEIFLHRILNVLRYWCRLENSNNFQLNSNKSYSKPIKYHKCRPLINKFATKAFNLFSANNFHHWPLPLSSPSLIVIIICYQIMTSNWLKCLENAGTVNAPITDRVFPLLPQRKLEIISKALQEIFCLELPAFMCPCVHR